MRIIVFFAVINSLVILNYKIFIVGNLSAQDVDIIKWMLGVSFGGKAGQSFAENIFTGGTNEKTNIDNP